MGKKTAKMNSESGRYFVILQYSSSWKNLLSPSYFYHQLQSTYLCDSGCELLGSHCWRISDHSMGRFSPFLLYVSTWNGIERVEDKHKKSGKDDSVPVTMANPFFQDYVSLK